MFQMMQSLNQNMVKLSGYSGVNHKVCFLYLQMEKGLFIITGDHFTLRVLTSSHLQRAVFLLQLLQRFSELLPSLFFQSRACKWTEDCGDYILTCYRQTGG